MADDIDTAEHHTDGQAAFIDRVAAKYEAEDAAHADAEDGVVAVAEEKEKDEDEEQDAGAPSTSGTEEHAEAGTPADDPDGDAAGSESDSSDDAAEDHPEGDEPDESDDDEAADDAGEEDEDAPEVEEDASDATKAALTARGADLTLDDVPEAYRGIVQKKLRGVDQAFTRVQQEAASFRSERAQFIAEQRFRDENPELALTEAIRQALEKDPNIFDKINGRFEKMEDADQAAAFEIVLKDKRAAAIKAVTDERDAAEQQFTQWQQRAEHVESTGKSLAAKAGLPWTRAERAIETALLRKPEGQRDLTDDEVSSVVAAEAKLHETEVRDVRRKASKDVVVTRTKTRAAAPPAIARTAASSPRAAATKTPKVDQNSEESRHRAMMATARRVLPGVKD